MNHLVWRRGAPGLVILMGASAAWAQGRTPRLPLQVVGGAGASTIVGAPPTGNIGVIPSVNTVPTGATIPAPTVSIPNPTIPVPTLTAPPAATPTQGGAPIGSVAPRTSQIDLELKPIQPVSGGMTSEQVGQRARTVSYDVAAKNEALRAAGARVDQAFVNFFPRVGGTARYTRLSSITPPTLGAPGVYSLAATGPGITPGAPLNLNDPNITVIGAPGFSFPVILNNYSVQASVSVPISDYFLRISRNYSATTHSEEAARLDRVAAEAKAMNDAKIAFYNWTKALAQREVLVQALEAAREHARDAEALFRAGQASKADLLGAQAQAAQAQLTVSQADEYLALSLDQLRLAIQAKPEETITLGENVLDSLPKATLDGTKLREEAINTRPELRSLTASEQALGKVASIQRAGAWPQINAVGNYYYQNPNTRIIPQQQKWTGTWDINLQASWAINDVFAASALGAEADANVAKLRAQRMQVRDGIMLEVTQAVTAAQTADAAVEAATLSLASAEEAYRVRKELYRVGRATSVELTDAEASLVRTRLTAVTARIDQRVARVRLEHATGRDLARLGSTKR